MRTTGLESRGRIRKRSLAIDQKSIRVARTGAAHVSGKIPVGIFPQRKFCSVDDNRNGLMLICPNSQMSSRVVDLSSHWVPPREGRALYRFFKHSISDTTAMDCISFSLVQQLLGSLTRAFGFSIAFVRRRALYRKRQHAVFQVRACGVGIDIRRPLGPGIDSLLENI